VYISGAITNRCPMEAKSHFDTVEGLLLKKGYTVFNPTIIPSGDWHKGMRMCVKNLMDCDMIYMLDGWKNSVGAGIERMLAMNVHIPVFYEADNGLNLKPYRIDG